MQLTRSLYVLQEVCLALMLSVWMVRTDEAIFWAWELWNSGFHQEVKDILWRIYYEFFACEHPIYESHMQLLLSKSPPLFENLLVDLGCRTINTDVFMLNILCTTFEEQAQESTKQTVLQCIKAKNFRTLMYRFKSTGLDEIKKIATKHKLTGEPHPSMPDLWLISKLMSPCYQPKSRKSKLEQELHDLNIHSNVLTSGNIQIPPGMAPRKHMTVLCKYGPNDSNLMHMFSGLNTERHQMLNEFRNHWLLHASSTPIWKKRIEDCSGNISSSSVTFSTDDAEELFYEQFGLEPDEQPMNIQMKCIPPFIKPISSWAWVNDKCLLVKLVEEEVQELNNEGPIWI